MWQKDCQIDDTKLDVELLKIPNLHSKYFGFYNDECLQQKKFYYEKKRLLKLKTIYYAGKMSQEELEDLGWEPFMFKIIKGYEPRIETYLAGDNDLIKASDKIVDKSLKFNKTDDIINYLVENFDDKDYSLFN